LTDDNSPQDYQTVIHPQIVYLIDEDHTGVIRLDPMNSVTCSVHIATRPEMWGRGHQFAKDVMKWGFKNTLYQKVVGIIPGYNDRVIKLVKDLGFKQEGMITKSFLKRWKLHDQLIFCLNKGDVPCQ